MACRIDVKGPVRKIFEHRLPPHQQIEVYEFDREGNQVPDPAAACAAQPSDIRVQGDGSISEVETISGSDFWTIAALNGVAIPTRGAAIAETTFAADGVPIETVFRAKDGADAARIRYSHDEKQRISEAVMQTIMPPALPPRMAAWAETATPSERGPLAYELDPNVALRFTFRYDDDGRSVERSQFYDNVLFDRITSAYNEHGDIVAVTHLTPAYEVPQHSEHEYEYDKWGNWIRRFVRLSAGEILECRREITYYE